MDDSATTAALVAMAMALIEVVKKLANGRNGGDNSEFRLKNLEEQTNNIYKKIDKMESSFYEFREETRIRWARTGDDE